jgi:hypothetical protein
LSDVVTNPARYNHFAKIMFYGEITGNCVLSLLSIIIFIAPAIAITMFLVQLATIVHLHLTWTTAHTAKHMPDDIMIVRSIKAATKKTVTIHFTVKHNFCKNGLISPGY